MKRRRFLLMTVALTGTGVGYWWWQGRLTAEEQQLVGRWVCYEKYDDGSSCIRTWNIGPDHQAKFQNQYHFAATAERAARDEVMEGTLFWSYRRGQLVVVPEHPPLEKVRVLAWMTERRIRNLMQGKQEIVMDSEGSNGRLSHLDQNSFTVHWWNPDTKAESKPVTYKSMK
jgi:hypothetical protein